MKTIITGLILSVCVLPAVRALDTTEADAQLMSFSREFNEVELAANERKAQLLWFVAQGDEGREYVKDAYGDSKEIAVRKAALYLCCRGWLEWSGEVLRKAENTKDVALRDFSRRLHTYLSGLRPTPPGPEQPAVVALFFRAPKDRAELLGLLQDALNARSEGCIDLALIVAGRYASLAFEKSDWPLAVAAAANETKGAPADKLIKHLQLNMSLLSPETRKEIIGLLKRDIFENVTPPEPDAPGWAEKQLANAQNDPQRLVLVLGVIARRGDVHVLSAVAPYLDNANDKVAQAALDVFILHAAALNPDVHSPKRCFIWWNTVGNKAVHDLK